MELPITRPSMVSYADEIEFPVLLKDISEKKHYGFIRITLNSDEGYILFKEGDVIAASYERYSRVDAVEKIKDAMQEKGTLVEIFDVRPNQIDFFMDINKPYLINSEAYDLIDELKGTNKKEAVPEPKAVPKAKPISEAVNKSDADNDPNSDIVKPKPEMEKITEPAKLAPASVPETITDSDEKTQVKEDSVIKSEEKISGSNDPETVPEVDSSENSENMASENSSPEVVPDPIETKTEIKGTIEDSPLPVTPVSEEKSVEAQDQKVKEDELENAEMPPMDRSELLKKYGIKDIQEEEVDNLLESYKGGSVSDEDIEKIELTLMNKIKKSLLAIPKIKGAEVMVFLENNDGLSGKVNIMIESESKGFLSRIIGESKDSKLEKQIIDISQIEIRKSFRKYPEIVDKFEVNVEIS